MVAKSICCCCVETLPLVFAALPSPSGLYLGHETAVGSVKDLSEA